MNEGLGTRGSGIEGGNPSLQSRSPSPTIVIGLGNPLMGDDGLGIAALERLRERWDVPADVELLDGGTWGMNLLPVIESAGRLLLIDAITVGARPGTVVVIPRARLPRYLATKISPHEVDLRDVLAVAELRGTLPDQTVAMGLEPARVELASALSDVVQSRLDDLLETVARELAAWGHRCSPKTEPVHA
jgi:hydrogenase maturation protease